MMEEEEEDMDDPMVTKELSQVLKESKEMRRSGLQEIRLWLDQQVDINPKTDDPSLLKFLRSCKYDMEKVKNKLTCYYKVRSKLPLWFQSRDPNLPAIQELLNIGVFIPLLCRDEMGRLVVVIRACSHDPRRHSLDDVFKTGLMVLDLILERASSAASVLGLVALFDLEGVSIRHARQLTINRIRNAVHTWQDCYPVRVKSLDFFNTPSYVNIVLDVFRRFMSPKLRERVHVHGYDLESLHNNISKDILPLEYGGTKGELEAIKEHWLREVTNAHSWYQEDEKYRAEL